MNKGKTGINLAFYATSAFILALLGQTLMCALLLGFAIVAEKDEWLTRQCIQAFAICFLMSIVSKILSIFDFTYTLPYVGWWFSKWLGAGIRMVKDLIQLCIYIVCIIGMVKVAKGKEAGIPVLDKFANWAVQDKES